MLALFRLKIADLFVLLYKKIFLTLLMVDSSILVPNDAINAKKGSQIFEQEILKLYFYNLYIYKF
jgi:hypothetical protein